jgi:beta-glucanase (GH16 family)
VRRISLFLVLGLAQTIFLAGTTWAQDMRFSDDFTYFDTTRWSEGDHMLGRSYLDPANVSVDGQNLRITLPARSLEGGEILTNGLQGYGYYSARMRVPNAPSSITGFFLYKAPDYESEIDIEVFNDSTRRVMFTTYAGGTQTHTVTRTLPFEPTTGFHEYAFDYARDPLSGEASVTFYADGQEMMSWDTGVPRTSMHLMLNSWFPRWLDGRKLKKNTHTYVDRIYFQAQP